MRIALAIDASTPQTNGAVTTLKATAATLAGLGRDVRVISPQGLTTIAGSSYPEIRLALAPGAGVARELKPSAGTPSPRPRGSSPASRRYRRRGAPGWP